MIIQEKGGKEARQGKKQATRIQNKTEKQEETRQDLKGIMTISCDRILSALSRLVLCYGVLSFLVLSHLVVACGCVVLFVVLCGLALPCVLSCLVVVLSCFYLFLLYVQG
jgi:hypothetical protein